MTEPRPIRFAALGLAALAVTIASLFVVSLPGAPTAHAAAGPALSASAPLTRPISSVAQSGTGGDGFAPFVYRDAATGRTTLWNLYHHAGIPQNPATAPTNFFGDNGNLFCTDPATSAPCSGGPWPKSLSSQPGPFGSGPADLTTAIEATPTPDPGGSPGVFYFPATRQDGTIGVGCLDLAPRRNCGYHPLAKTANGSTGSNTHALVGLVVIGSQLWGATNTGTDVCFDTRSQSACAGQPFATGRTPSNNGPIAASTAYYGAGDYAAGIAAEGSKVFVSQSDYQAVGATTVGPTLSCFDTASRQACAGWPATGQPIGDTTFSPHQNAYWLTDSAFPVLDASGAASAMCAEVSHFDLTGNTTTSVHCFSFSGASVPAPSGAVFGISDGHPDNGAIFFSAREEVWNPLTITDPVNGHLVSYFPSGFFPSSAGEGPAGGGQATTDGGAAICLDWATGGSRCAAFGVTGMATWPQVNSGHTRDYGYAADDACGYGLGDAGVLWSFDLHTGSTPCRSTSGLVRLAPADAYCAQFTGHHATAWTTVTLTGTGTSVTTPRVTIRDSKGVAVPNFVQVPYTGPIDISSIPVSGSTASLQVSVLAGVADTTAWDGGATPTVTISASGPTPDPVPCAPGLSIDKTVDRATAVPGDTLTYKVTVTNTGNLPATNVAAADTLPNQVAFVQASDGGASDGSGGVTWTIASLAPGQSVTYTVEAKVKPGVFGATLVNKFGITPPSGWPAPQVNHPCTDTPARACAVTTTPRPGLVQDKVVDKAKAVAGDQLTYEVTLHNTGAIDLTGVTGTDTLPAQVAFVSADTHGSGTYDPARAVWSAGTIKVGATARLAIVARVKTGVVSTTLVNRFQAVPPAGTPTTVLHPCADEARASCAPTVVPGPVPTTDPPTTVPPTTAPRTTIPPTTRPRTTIPPTTRPVTTVPPVVVSPVPPAEHGPSGPLALTGAPIVALGGLGVVLAGAGAILWFAGRRKPGSAR